MVFQLNSTKYSRKSLRMTWWHSSQISIKGSYRHIASNSKSAKKGDAIRIHDYRPIFLLNVSFKILTKVAIKQISKVSDNIIKPSQTTFMSRPFMNCTKKKKNGSILKIYFEKAYDKVKWSFLQQVLRMKGFSKQWCDWIQSFVSGGHVGVKVNDDTRPFFQTSKGLWQGDPLSPILFNIVADMLAILIARAKEDGQIKGVVLHLVDDGLSIL